MQNDIKPYILISLLVHIGALTILYFRLSGPQMIYLPIELQFYSSKESNPYVVQKPAPKVKQAQKEKKKNETIKIKENGKVKFEAKPAETPKAAESAKPQAQPGTGNQAVQSSNIRLESPNFKYSYYTNAVVKKIAQNWSWSKEFGKLKAVVYFRIQRDGSIKDLSIKDSSGDEIYDAQALRSIELSSPFPPLPDEYKENSLGVYFEFTYAE